MSEYIFVTDIFEYSNIRIYSSHSDPYTFSSGNPCKETISSFPLMVRSGNTGQETVSSGNQIRSGKSLRRKLAGAWWWMACGSLCCGSLTPVCSGAQHSQFSTGFRADTTSPSFLSNHHVVSDEYDGIFPDGNITQFENYEKIGKIGVWDNCQVRFPDLKWVGQSDSLTSAKSRT